MKTKIAITGFLLTATLSLSAQWEKVNSGTGANLRDVHFPDFETGYTVGDRIILKTVDSGQSWSMINDSLRNLNWVYFFDAQTGIVCSYNYLFSKDFLYRTTDGGSTWHEISISNKLKIAEFTSIQDTIYIISWESPKLILYKSSNYGITWDLVTDSIAQGPGFYIELSFITKSTGFMYQPYAPIRKTTDGGQTWDSVGIAPMVSEIRGELAFYNRDIGFVGGNYNPMLARTTDGGNNWHLILIDSLIPTISSIAIYGSTVYAAAEISGKGKIILYSPNLGNTWEEQDVNTNLIINDIHPLDERNAVAVGNGGLILRKMDTTAGNVSIKKIRSQNDKFKVFPNPTGDRIFLEWTDDIKVLRITLTDMNGKMMMKYRDMRHTIDTGGLKSGQYFISFHTDKGMITEKVIIEK